MLAQICKHAFNYSVVFFKLSSQSLFGSGARFTNDLGFKYSPKMCYFVTNLVGKFNPVSVSYFSSRYSALYLYFPLSRHLSVSKITGFIDPSLSLSLSIYLCVCLALSVSLVLALCLFLSPFSPTLHLSISL